MNEVNQYWNRALEIIKEENNSPISFEAWISPIIPYKIEGNSFILQIEEPFYRDTIKKRYLSLIRNAINKATNKEYEIKIITEEELPQKSNIHLQKLIILYFYMVILGLEKHI